MISSSILPSRHFFARWFLFTAYIRAAESRKVAVERQKLLDAERISAAHEQQKRIDAERELTKRREISEEKARDILAYESIKDKFTQQTEKIIDCYGN